MRKGRLPQLAGVAAWVLIVVVVAVVAGSVVIVLTGTGGYISCAATPLTARAEPVPRWVIAAGVPAVIPTLVAAYFALGAERVRWRFVGLAFAGVVAAGTFFGVYSLLPVSCRP